MAEIVEAESWKRYYALSLYSMIAFGFTCVPATYYLFKAIVRREPVRPAYFVFSTILFAFSWFIMILMLTQVVWPWLHDHPWLGVSIF